jgi:hypothetical protein
MRGDELGCKPWLNQVEGGGEEEEEGFPSSFPPSNVNYTEDMHVQSEHNSKYYSKLYT